jgi:type IV pilus assembly protein PilY1
MNRKTLLAVLAVLGAATTPFAAQAQTAISEDFTGKTTTNSWWFFNGACLTASTLAGSEPAGSSAGQIPGCTTIAASYYNKTAGEVLVGGFNGTFPDPAGNGALRFTNGYPYGYSENGAVIFATPFPSGQGVAVTFKTVTYLGNSGGTGGDGADGLSFYLMDASKLNTAIITGTGTGDGNGIGSWGGSLAYTCSNSNTPFNGLIGGYLGLGIDEYGNFLNGTTNTLGETGTSATGDNTASGGGYQPGRIGLRGAGNIAWLTLNGAYGSNPNNSAKPYYPASLSSSCAIAGGAYNAGSGSCMSCSSGTYNAGANACLSCASGTLSGTQCVDICAANYTYDAFNGMCTRAGHPNETPTSQAAASAAANSGNTDSFYSVQNTCQNGTLYNYSTASNPTSAGTTTLTNTVNTGLASANIAPILDYAALPGGYTVLPTTNPIAAEGATTRGKAVPIFYDLKITQNGLLSLSYSYNGGAYQSVITKANITTANGTLPANLLFGFAGSTGGSSNIHEILCFKAEPATSAAASAGASEKQSAKLETGAQAYFAYYNPSNGWTGSVTASGLGFDQYGNVIVAATPNWDAACDLTGVPTGFTCTSTLAAGPIPAQVPASRVMLSWNGTTGIPFEYTNLTAAQQNTLNAGDTSGSPALSSLTCPGADSESGLAAGAGYSVKDRLDFLRGDRACEINSASVGLFRKRTSVLADVIDSSPTWVGPPVESYSSVWTDRAYPTAIPAENATTAQTYATYTTNNQARLNVVYVGSNDGLLHGFRSGYFSSPNNFVSVGNDGQEVLAYMPGAVVQTIHSTTAAVDYANAQYGHNFFVDATPGTGDVFFGGAWHTWLVGGLGAGGAALYALDVSNPSPTNFVEGNAANLVIGEWTPATLTCAIAPLACGTNLGNTYGTPQIRRLHDGKWAVIFGNGLGSASGDAGIYIMTIDPNTGDRNFYYLSTHTGSAASPNGISFASPVDLDGDHITDYVYAGDLQGNVWRFDLTSNLEANWAVTPGPLFKTPAGQPITTAVVAASGAPSPGMQQYLMILFGTGQKVPLTNATPATYATAPQSLYGVWDWNMTAWNTLEPGASYASLAPAATGLSTTNHYAVTANLQSQTVTVNTTTLNRDITTNATICWAGQTGCTGSAAQFGWTLTLPGTQEQIIYNPEMVAQALTVNSIVPAANNPTSCASPSDTGFTYLLSAMTGGAFTQVFLPPSEASNPNVNTNPAYLDQYAIGMQTNATGGSFITSNNGGTEFLVFETNSAGGGSGVVGANLPPNTTGRRLGWIERR